jgi:5-formyltetrahydrofolate cyclo-ligase
VLRRFTALSFFGPARSVALFAAQPFELPTSPIFEACRAAGKTVSYPRVRPGSRALTFHSIGSLTELVPLGRLQLLSPPDSNPVDLATIDLVVVPGVAFGLDGSRLGRGGGYYDTTLGLMTRARRVAVTFDCCLTGSVPTEPHDLGVEYILTESRTIEL